MKRFAGRSAHFDRLTTLLTDPAAVASVQSGSDLPADLSAWLGRMQLLYGIPFAYLVPDESLLPVESLRFFFVDRSWVDALVEGAFSIGDATAGDAVQTSVLTPRVHAAAASAARLVRPGGQRPPAAAERPGTVEVSATIEAASGFLLRSRVVSGWPTLEVTGYDEAGNPLTVLRMDHLAPGVLLFLVEGLVHHVDIHEPAEGLHFGLDVGDDGSAEVRTRWVTVPARAPAGAPNGGGSAGDPTSPGMLIPGDSVPAPLRPGGRRALDIEGLAAAVKARLATEQANNNPDGSPRPFTAAELGLQMVEGVASVRFGCQQPQGAL